MWTDEDHDDNDDDNDDDDIVCDIMPCGVM